MWHGQRQPVHSTHLQGLFGNGVSLQTGDDFQHRDHVPDLQDKSCTSGWPPSLLHLLSVPAPMFMSGVGAQPDIPQQGDSDQHSAHVPAAHHAPCSLLPRARCPCCHMLTQKCPYHDLTSQEPYTEEVPRPSLGTWEADCASPQKPSPPPVLWQQRHSAFQMLLHIPLWGISQTAPVRGPGLWPGASQAWEVLGKGACVSCFSTAGTCLTCAA